jgi:hypothetical protein
MLAPNYALELSIADYLTSQLSASGSLLSGSQTVFYTGIGNVDIQSGSVVIIDASDMVENQPYTRNYTFTVDIRVKEIAADVISKGTTAMAVFNEFTNNDTAKVNFTNPELNIGVFNVREAKMRPSVSGDALVNEITVIIEGALIPS